ncbi:MAG: nucleotide sugar dehydrogenase [Oscillospiraceae bacterium]|jgi:UDP-N-acetyl-D-glucosamine dehydrogenase|nr:nucleotide sugar dehydrogenase [Oscillospiraceae bacterium]
MKEILIKKIKNKELKVAVVGLGYVGLPLAIEFAKSGYETVGLDIIEEKVNSVNSSTNYVADVLKNELEEVVSSGLMRATIDFSCIQNLDFIAICVPTPLDHQQPDLTCVKQSLKFISKFLKKNSIIVLESTTYPGTTEGIVKNTIEKNSSLKCEKDFYLGFSPERVDPGNCRFKIKNTPKIVGAVGKDALEVIALIYSEILRGNVYKVSSPAAAEMEKILENTYRNINIALVNEMAVLCNKMDINIWEVVEAAKTKPYGFQAFYPGPGLGGHCIPLDPHYLSWKAKEYGFHTSMIEASSAINDGMSGYCVDRISKILNKFYKPINGSKILILGVAYKQDVADYRESPALEILEKLKNLGALVDFYDPFISICVWKDQMLSGVKYMDNTIVGSYDIVVITTAHSDVDYEMIAKNSKVIFDTRNALKNIEYRDNIELL